MMNKILKRMLTGILLVCMLMLTGPAGLLTSWAGNTKIAFSDPSVMVGNDVSVTVKVTSDSALGSAEIMLSYDASVLEFVSGTNANGGAGAIKLLGTMSAADQKSFSFNLKFKTLQAGTTQIQVTSQEIYDMDSNAVALDKQGSSTVKVTSPASYSKDATLKSLKISPGTLTPEFSSAVEAYTAAVDGAIDKLVVNAVAANAGASVSLQGAEGLKLGENQVVVKVTAEDKQTVKKYTITVTKAEGTAAVPSEGVSGESQAAEFGDVKVTVDDKEYSVATAFDPATLPEGFEEITYSYKGTDVMAGNGLEKKLLLLYLKDGGGNGSFYIYAEDSDSWTRFIQLNTSSKAIIIVAPDDAAVVPEGFEARKILIDDNEVNGWISKSEGGQEYCLVYAMNWNGETGFYRYDLTEKTIQRYFASGVSYDTYTATAQKYNELTKSYNIQFYLLLGLGVLAVIQFILLIVLLRRRDKGQGPEPGSRQRQPGRSSKEIKRDESDDLDSGTGFRPGSGVDSFAGNVKRYSREEFDQEAEEADNFGSFGDPDDDDFEEEASLEDMEKELLMRSSRPMVEKRPVNVIRKPVPADRPPSQPHVPQAEPEDDDFEIMDIDI